MVMLLPGAQANKKTTLNHAKKTVSLSLKNKIKKSVQISSIHSDLELEEAAR